MQHCLIYVIEHCIHEFIGVNNSENRKLEGNKGTAYIRLRIYYYFILLTLKTLSRICETISIDIKVF